MEDIFEYLFSYFVINFSIQETKMEFMPPQNAQQRGPQLESHAFNMMFTKPLFTYVQKITTFGAVAAELKFGPGKFVPASHLRP